MEDCLISPVKEIGKCILTQHVWPFLKSQVYYWWFCDRNIKFLRDEIPDLERKIEDVTKKIDEAPENAEIRRRAVHEWLSSSKQKLEEARTTLPNDNIPAWKLISRYSLGKNAKETAEAIANLLYDGMRLTTDVSTMDFDSRKHIEEKIIDSLDRGSVGVIGICGMGGVGKTTMAKRIGRRVKEENLFDEVAMTTVSQNIEELKIQEEIAENLDLKLEEKTLFDRAKKLRTRLMDSKRKIIIFDDVWKSLEFEKLGIPIESNLNRCKFLFTSRSRESCNDIENKEVFELKTLGEEEAWNLFRERAGKCAENFDVARDIVKECNGLPIALVTVGSALRTKTNIHEWKDSLSKLRKSNPTDFPEVLEYVYKPLKLSYDCLSESEGRLFLLCCLFPEDFDIDVEQLTWYSMGLRLFQGINNIEEARNRTHTLIEKLKRRFLLIDVGKYAVKMHDVIRDVAIYIGSREKDGFLKSLHGTSIENSSDINYKCNWMSVDISNEGMEVSVLSRFPKLRLLMLQQKSRWSSNEILDISVEGMTDLNVLSFRNTLMRSLPQLGSLKNLQTLCLFYCEVENISVIGELTSLKILNCHGCAKIKELPEEIRSLSGLRLLKLFDCKLLQTIPFGVISSLGRLEELKMWSSFSRWEAEENGKERRNASLTELECLPNLSCLEIEIDDCTLSVQEICLSQNLVKYYIRIGSHKDFYSYYNISGYEKAMILNLPSGIGAVGKWIEMQVRNTECLYLEGDGCGSNNFNIAESENLRDLTVWNCSTLNKLVETKDCKFHNLKSIKISECPKLRSLFSVSVARTSLLQLEVLHIGNCESMEQVFWNEEGTDDNTDGCIIEFPKLKQLILWYLPNLTAFCQGLKKKDVSFCNLKTIEISGCPKLGSLFSMLVARTSFLQLEVLRIEECESMEQVFWNEEGTDDNTDGCIEFPKLKTLCLEDLRNLTAFCQGLEKKDVSFCNIKSIEITTCPKLRSLFSVSVARTSLLQLEDLTIVDCESMEQVFWNEEGTDDNINGCIEFPKLKKLRLEKLQNLTAFCQGLENIIIIKFPNLTEMNIGGLPKLNSVSPLNSETLVGHDQNTRFHFLCNPKVEMCGLKILGLASGEDNIRNIWCPQIPNNIFNNLETLLVAAVNGIRSLMSTSIAKNLVSLKELNIFDCEEMVEVIERDDDDDKQVVDINCLFSKLRKLKIEDSNKLRWFWQWNHAWELPLLEEVKISNCLVMEAFTLGSINTPSIRKIKVNKKKIDDLKDLNDVIRHIHIESQETSKEKDEERKRDEYDHENVNKDENSNERKSEKT